MKHCDEAARATLALIDVSRFPGERELTGRGVPHAVWMLNEIQTLNVQGNKAHRWLGYAHGILVQHGVLTLEQAKDINRRIADSEETSEEIGSIASRLLNHPEEDVRRLAGSALTQRPDRRD